MDCVFETKCPVSGESITCPLLYLPYYRNRGISAYLRRLSASSSAPCASINIFSMAVSFRLIRASEDDGLEIIAIKLEGIRRVEVKVESFRVRVNASALIIISGPCFLNSSAREPTFYLSLRLYFVYLLFCEPRYALICPIKDTL